MAAVITITETYPATCWNCLGEPTLAQILREEGMVPDEDIEAAIKTRGGTPLTDTRGTRYSAQVVCDGNDPQAIIQYLLSLAVRRGASELHIEPREDGIAVKYRIDGVSFRLDPIPKRMLRERGIELVARGVTTFDEFQALRL